MAFSDYINSNGSMTPLPGNLSVAMAYVPFQCLMKTYDADRALEAGTLFPDLNKPFLNGRGEEP